MSTSSQERIDVFELLCPDFDNTLKSRLDQSGITVNPVDCSEDQADTLIKTVHTLALDCTDAAVACVSSIDSIKKDNFYNHFYEKWGKSIALSLVLEQLLTDLMLCIKPATTNDIKEFVLQKLFGKAIRTYMEINTLIRFGFPNGAIALVRVLYELWICLSFIEKNDDSIASAYLKKATDPLTEPGTRDNYDWAKTAACFRNKKGIIKLHHLYAEIAKTEFSKFDSHNYAAYNKFIHAAPQTINDTPDSDWDTITIGPLQEMIQKPAIASVCYLYQILPVVRKWFENRDLFHRYAFCLDWMTIVCESYAEAGEK